MRNWSQDHLPKWNHKCFKLLIVIRHGETRARKCHFHFGFFHLFFVTYKILSIRIIFPNSFLKSCENVKFRIFFIFLEKKPDSDSFGEKLATNVIKNIQITVKNIHIRYEDSVSKFVFQVWCGKIVRNQLAIKSIWFLP